MVVANQTKSRLQLAEDALHRVQVRGGTGRPLCLPRPWCNWCRLAIQELDGCLGACVPCCEAVQTWQAGASCPAFQQQVELEKTQFELQAKRGACCGERTAAVLHAKLHPASRCKQFCPHA